MYNQGQRNRRDRRRHRIPNYGRQREGEKANLTNPPLLRHVFIHAQEPGAPQSGCAASELPAVIDRDVVSESTGELILLIQYDLAAPVAGSKRVGGGQTCAKPWKLLCIFAVEPGLESITHPRERGTWHKQMLQWDKIRSFPMQSTYDRGGGISPIDIDRHIVCSTAVATTLIVASAPKCVTTQNEDPSLVRKFVHEVGARGLEQQLRGAQEEVRRLRGEMVGGTSKREAFGNTLRRHLNYSQQQYNLVSKSAQFFV